MPKGFICEGQINMFDLPEETKESKMDTEDININININIGDLVEFQYAGERHKGNIYSIYNNGQTVNVSWNNKIAPFYIGCVKVMEG